MAVREAEADLDLEISGVSYDSRKTQPGDLFVAMTGYATDGHKFIPMAREKGAACVLCQEKPEGEGPWVLVEDSRAALAQVGRNWYGDPAASMTMVGVTGTNGKTTTTYLLKDILEQAAGAKVGLIGTNQNMIGGGDPAHGAHHPGVLRAPGPPPPDGGRGVHPRGDGGLLPRPVFEAGWRGSASPWGSSPI